jgi:hypothetical protein
MVKFPAAKLVEIPVPPEYVVVATHVGTPAFMVRTKPLVLGAIEPSVLALVKYGIALAAPEKSELVAIERFDDPSVMTDPVRPRPSVAVEVAVVFNVPLFP